MADRWLARSMSYGRGSEAGMVDVVVFNILIPCTENATGMVHPPAKFDAWVLETADRFGGVTVVGLALQGLWFDPDLPREANPIEDHSNWYKVGSPPSTSAYFASTHEKRLDASGRSVCTSNAPGKRSSSGILRSIRNLLVDNYQPAGTIRL